MFEFKSSLFYLIVPPKYQNHDTGSSDMLKRSLNMVHLSEKVKILSLIRKKTNKQTYAEVTEVYDKKESSVKL